VEEWKNNRNVLFPNSEIRFTNDDRTETAKILHILKMNWKNLRRLSSVVISKSDFTVNTVVKRRKISPNNVPIQFWWNQVLQERDEL
jgi:hypothetical protein